MFSFYSIFTIASLFLLSTYVNNHYVSSFTTITNKKLKTFVFSSSSKKSPSLYMAFGLGPVEEVEEVVKKEEEIIDYEEPDHELYRKSRLSKSDKQADAWFTSLLGNVDQENRDYPLGNVSKNIMKRILTPVKLQQDPIRDEDDPEWKPEALIPRVLPWNPILPAYGLETYGIPVPRRGAEAWRNSDLPGLLATDYSLDISNSKRIDDDKNLKNIFKKKGYWLNDDECTARMIYINGQFYPSLSKTIDNIYNLQPSDFTSSDNEVSKEILNCLEHLPDGCTDKLPQEEGQKDIKEIAGTNLLSKLSGPVHNVGNATSQYAINNQQGTAIFCALNSVKACNVGVIQIPDSVENDKPTLVVNAWTNDAGIDIDYDDNDNDGAEKKGVTVHPRLLVLAGKNSVSSLIQGTIDLDDDHDSDSTRPKFYNGYTQLYLRERSKVSHSYIDESGGYPTPNVEVRNNDVDSSEISPQEIESNRPALQNTHFEMIDIHATGANSTYKHTCLGISGNGRSRISTCATMYQPDISVEINGFSLNGGTQRSDILTTVHHIAPNTYSKHIQKNLVGGRATTLFKGRIRMEQNATLCDSQQLSRTILLSDVSKIWAIPSLEIVPAEVKCSHGSTVSDLSDEELFYLRSRGFDRLTARKLLMAAFLQECTLRIAPEILSVSHNDSEEVEAETQAEENSLSSRLGKRLQGVTPQGDRSWKKQYQSI